jgi:3-phosphoshikimate 1-carboxyvinyltransferase
MGASLEIDEQDAVMGEPVGAVRARAGGLEGIAIGADTIPRLIDEIPILAVVATQAEGTTEITGASELRVKESDRIEALAAGLTTIGADVIARPDGLVINGPTKLHGGTVESFGDHRIAMAFAIAGLLAQEKVTVTGWSCVDTSFPGFLETLSEAMHR